MLDENDHQNLQAGRARRLVPRENSWARGTNKVNTDDDVARIIDDLSEGLNDF